MGAVRPDPEVLPKAKRRAFTAAYKRAILERVDRCTEPGQIGALLRREGWYSSHLTHWRRERDAALAAGLAPHKRGRPSILRDPRALRIAELERETEHLRRQLHQARAIIEVQKKVSALFEIPLNGPEIGRKH